MNTKTAFPEELGRKARGLRKETGKTLGEIASAAGVTSSFLSQFENGKVSPSLETLFRIANALGKDPVLFFPGGDSKIRRLPVITEDRSTGSSYQELFPDAGERIMKPVIIRLARDGEIRRSFLDCGGEIFVSVLKGRLEVVCMNDGRVPNISGKGYEISWHSEKFVLSDGESFYYNTGRPEKVFNPFKEEAKILWIAGIKRKADDSKLSVD